MKFLGGLGIVAIIVLLIGFVFWYDSSIPNSTEGVSVVDGNTARLPEGATFVLTHQVGKTTDIWQITYDGENAVRFHCQSFLCSDLDTARLCGPGCKVTIDAPWPSDDFIVSLREDGAVNVVWPYGWVIRPYEP